MEKFIFFIFVLMYSYILKNDTFLNRNFILIILMAFAFSSVNTLLLYLSAKTTRISNFILFLLVTITNISLLMVFSSIEGIIFISTFLFIDGLMSYPALEKEPEKPKESVEPDIITDYFEDYSLPSISDFNLSEPKEVVESLDNLHFKEAAPEKHFVFPVNLILNFIKNIHTEDEEKTDFKQMEYEIVNEEKMIIKAFLLLAEGDSGKADEYYRKWNKYIRRSNSSENNFSDMDMNINKEISKVFYSFLNGLFHLYTKDYELSKLYFQSIIESSYSDHFYYDNAVEKLRLIDTFIEKRA